MGEIIQNDKWKFIDITFDESTLKQRFNEHLRQLNLEDKIKCLSQVDMEMFPDEKYRKHLKVRLFELSNEFEARKAMEAQLKYEKEHQEDIELWKRQQKYKVPVMNMSQDLPFIFDNRKLMDNWYSLYRDMVWLRRAFDLMVETPYDNMYRRFTITLMGLWVSYNDFKEEFIKEKHQDKYNDVQWQEPKLVFEEVVNPFAHATTPKEKLKSIVWKEELRRERERLQEDYEERNTKEGHMNRRRLLKRYNEVIEHFVKDYNDIVEAFNTTFSTLREPLDRNTEYKPIEFFYDSQV